MYSPVIRQQALQQVLAELTSLISRAYGRNAVWADEFQHVCTWYLPDVNSDELAFRTMFDHWLDNIVHFLYRCAYQDEKTVMVARQKQDAAQRAIGNDTAAKQQMARKQQMQAAAATGTDNRLQSAKALLLGKTVPRPTVVSAQCASRGFKMSVSQPLTYVGLNPPAYRVLSSKSALPRPSAPDA